MNKDTLQLLFDIAGPILVVVSLAFLYRKMYYHSRFLAFLDINRKNFSLAVFWKTLLQHIYVLIPFFYRSERIKNDSEMIFETKIVRNLTTFWIMFASTLVLMGVLNVLIYEDNITYILAKLTDPR